ncbi:MAG: phosphoglycolate phosphatase [Alphaproteobacteria bacterium]|nr:phosphoglycolate phosphatase [Alphaproteobacteria bacterium]
MSLQGAVVAFDLDGTLVDTAPDLVRALNHTLDLEGLPHASLAQARQFVGQGARKLIERASAASGVDFDAPKLDALTDAFIAFYRQAIAQDSTPFPGCLDALDALEAAGAGLCVCTNKRTDLSEALLDALGMRQRFRAIVGADSVANKKPHPEHVLTAIARAGGLAHRAVMVGDSSADVRAAQAANVKCIVVSFGYHDAAPHSLGADIVADHFNAIPRSVAALLA